MSIIITVWLCYLTQAGSKLATTRMAIQHHEGHKNIEIRQSPYFPLSFIFQENTKFSCLLTSKAFPSPPGVLCFQAAAWIASPCQLAPRDCHSSPAFLAPSFPVHGSWSIKHWEAKTPSGNLIPLY